MRLPLTARLAAAAAALAGACRTSPEPPPPPFEVAADHYVGTVHTGPVSGEVPGAEGAWAVELRVASVARAPAGPSGSVSSLARHVFVEGGAETFRTRGELALGSRVVGGPAPSGSDWEEQRIEALLPGSTVAWTAAPHPGAEDRPAPPWDRLTVQLSRRRGAPDRLETAVVFEGRNAPSTWRREHVVLEASPALDGDPWRLFAPAPTAEHPDGGLLLELRVDPTPELADFEQARARAIENLALARDRARARSAALTPSESFHFESRGALAALERRELQRPALVFLAQQTGAELTGEVALSVDAETLDEYLAAVRGRLDDGVPTDEAVALGWFLDSTVYLWMAATAEDAERGLSPELRALLLVHCGELGRYPDLVKEVVEESAGLAELRERLVRENLIFLESGHPTARLRACDWLAARGIAPAGFDPLAPLPERRAALAAAELEGPR